MKLSMKAWIGAGRSIHGMKPGEAFCQSRSSSWRTQYRAIIEKPGLSSLASERTYIDYSIADMFDSA
jgi:hypothetical protein